MTTETKPASVVELADELEEVMAEGLAEGIEDATNAIAAAALQEGQPTLPGMEPPPGLWPPVQGWRISRINFGVSGGVQLSAFLEHDVELAEKLSLGEEIIVTVRGTVERRGHKVVREKGDIIGIDGVASLTVTRLLETPAAVVRLMALQERLAKAMEAYHVASAGISGLELSDEARVETSRLLGDIWASLAGIDLDSGEWDGLDGEGVPAGSDPSPSRDEPKSEPTDSQRGSHEIPATDKSEFPHAETTATGGAE